jgi:hypothetical protein
MRSPKLEKSSSKGGTLWNEYWALASTQGPRQGWACFTRPDGVGQGRECSAQPGDWRKSAGDCYWMGMVDRPAALVGSIAWFQGLARCRMRLRRRQRRQARPSLICGLMLRHKWRA